MNRYEGGKIVASCVSGVLALLLVGCASARPPAAPAVAPAPSEVPPNPEVEPAPPPASSEAATAEAPAEKKPSRLRDLCRQTVQGEEALLDETRRRLEETFCGATLWFDGLLGGEPDVENARKVSGRVELSGLYTEFEGFDPKARLRLRYDLPTLERRLNVFLGRDDEEEFVEDRSEGFAVRSSVFGLERQEKWLAGLGYSPPGRWNQKLDFRVGARLKSSSEVFVQSRFRRNWFQGQRSVIRLRETVFWQNRDGFGSTTTLDLDHVPRQDLVLRWGSVATFSEATEGLAWRSALLLYHHFRKQRATAAELFVRGSTEAEVSLREYGARAVYRQPIGNKPYLFGSLILGYTWPRVEREEEREGSTMIGIGVELFFGREPL